MKRYAERYNTPPYGREIEGTDELLIEAADLIDKLVEEHLRICGKECYRYESSDTPKCPFFAERTGGCCLCGGEKN